LKEEFLAEVGHFTITMALVELDHILEALAPGLGGGAREIGVEIGLQLIEQHLQLGTVIITNVGDVGGIDENSPRSSQHRK
jgi:hypothetical protein